MTTRHNGGYNVRMIRCSLSGVLTRAAETCKNGGAQHLEFPLQELLKNLDEMYRRRAEPGILEEFFALYVAPSEVKKNLEDVR